MRTGLPTAGAAIAGLRNCECIDMERERYLYMYKEEATRKLADLQRSAESSKVV